MLNIKQVENIIDTENEDNFISIKNLKNRQRKLKTCPLDFKEPIYFPLDYFFNKDPGDIFNTKLAVKFKNEVAEIKDVDLHNIVSFVTYDNKSTLFLTTMGLSISKSNFISWNELVNIDFKDNKLLINNYTLNFDYTPNKWQMIEFVFLCKFLQNLIKANEIPHNFKTEEELIIKTKEFEEFCKKAKKDSFSTTIAIVVFIFIIGFTIYNN